jgi:hypothetical protein
MSFVFLRNNREVSLTSGLFLSSDRTIKVFGNWELRPTSFNH